MSLTSDYRFNTYRRLNSLEGASNVALILASTALIVVSFIVALYTGKLGREEIYITIGQNCLPIIMLALSILVSGAKYGARSEKIHDCAQSLNHFKKLLKFDIEDHNFSPSSDNFKEYAKQYAEIIAKHENHSKVDLSIESLRTTKSTGFLKLLLELAAGLIGRGLLYYLYISISVMSVFWMLLGIYLAIRGVTPC
ncbi:SLATT domain-containing protein [Pseudomonas sp. MYb327]|uniref:SLATT domain-containing protein n=1 Tax=Pseudomonas sp. MYb327 TaxID=2745230 RepID=A0AAU8E013_9PSED